MFINKIKTLNHCKHKKSISRSFTVKLTYILCSKPSIMSFELIFLLHLLVKAGLFSQRMFVKPLE